jgi:hypothetical protein
VRYKVFDILPEMPDSAGRRAVIVFHQRDSMRDRPVNGGIERYLYGQVYPDACAVFLNL